MSVADLKAVSLRSCSALNKLGPQINWIQSYVTDDKVYCVYIAPNKEMIQEHARQAGVPANLISVVSTIIDPTTAEG
jgi:hypothetical protein